MSFFKTILQQVPKEEPIPVTLMPERTTAFQPITADTEAMPLPNPSALEPAQAIPLTELNPIPAIEPKTLDAQAEGLASTPPPEPAKRNWETNPTAHVFQKDNRFRNGLMAVMQDLPMALNYLRDDANPVYVSSALATMRQARETKARNLQKAQMTAQRLYGESYDPNRDYGDTEDDVLGAYDLNTRLEKRAAEQEIIKKMVEANPELAGSLPKNWNGFSMSEVASLMDGFRKSQKTKAKELRLENIRTAVAGSLNDPEFGKGLSKGERSLLAYQEAYTANPDPDSDGYTELKNVTADLQALRKFGLDWQNIKSQMDERRLKGEIDRAKLPGQLAETQASIEAKQASTAKTKQETALQPKELAIKQQDSNTRKMAALNRSDYARTGTGIQKKESTAQQKYLTNRATAEVKSLATQLGYEKPSDYSEAFTQFANAVTDSPSLRVVETIQNGVKMTVLVRLNENGGWTENDIAAIYTPRAADGKELFKSYVLGDR